MPLTKIQSLGITDGTIVNADINASAAITLAKLTGVNDAKAWVNFNGTGTVAIRASFNVTSITDNATSDYTINFTTAMSDANYSVGGMSMRISDTITSGNSPHVIMIHGNATYGNAVTTSSVRINAKLANGNNEDPLAVSVQIFR
jgi:hypothetical protein